MLQTQSRAGTTAVFNTLPCRTNKEAVNRPSMNLATHSRTPTHPPLQVGAHKAFQSSTQPLWWHPQSRSNGTWLVKVGIGLGWGGVGGRTKGKSPKMRGMPEFNLYPQFGSLSLLKERVADCSRSERGGNMGKEEPKKEGIPEFNQYPHFLNFFEEGWEFLGKRQQHQERLAT
jgi:hypothetical protein